MTTTTNKGYTVPIVGGDFNIWGNELNADLQILDKNLGGISSINMAGSVDVTATGSQAQSLVLNLVGILTGNVHLKVPAVGSMYIIDNNTTGAFSVTVITSAGGSTGVAVPQGYSELVWSDATNIHSATDAYSPGAALTGGNLISINNGTIGLGTIAPFSFLGNLGTGSALPSALPFGTDFMNSGGTLALGTIATSGTFGSASVIPVVTLAATGRVSHIGTIAAAGATPATLGTYITGGTIYGSGTIDVNTGTSGAHVPLMSTHNTWVGQAGSIGTFTGSGTVTLDMATAQHFRGTLTGNITLALPSNLIAGQAGQIIAIQDGTGSRTITLASGWETPGGAGITLAATAGAKNILTYFTETGSTAAIANSGTAGWS